jgi:ATP-dependent 26S proteasome regulatory subunit
MSLHHAHCVINPKCQINIAFQVVACLKDAQRYARLNAKMPSGVLLCGAPGTGKTLLGECGAGL